LFDKQEAAYRESVLPASLKLRVGCEAGIRQGWDKYLGLEGHFVGMNSFGASAPANKLYEHFKITAEEIVRCVKSSL
jgi:transketolase